MRKLFIALPLAVLAGCTTTQGPAPMAGVWKGELNCPGKKLSAQQITITLQDGIFPGLLTGDLENYAVRDGKTYHLHYKITGATVGGKVRLKPGEMITDTSNGYLYGLVFEASRVTNDSMMMHFDYCNQDKYFNRVSTAPGKTD